MRFAPALALWKDTAAPILVDRGSETSGHREKKAPHFEGVEGKSSASIAISKDDAESSSEESV